MNLIASHIRHLNPLKTHPKGIAKADKRMVHNLDYVDIKFPVSKKIIARMIKKITFALMYFVMKMI